MPIIKESKNYLKFIEFEGEESIYLSINAELENLFDYLKNYIEIMNVPEEEVMFTYHEAGNLDLFYTEGPTSINMPSMAEIEAYNSKLPVINEQVYCSLEEESDEEDKKEIRTDYFIKSFITILSSVFEKNMEKLCYKIKQMNNLKLTRKDLPGGLVCSYKKFLNIYGGIKSIDKKLWDLLFDIIKIRNMIVHSNLDYIFNDELRELKLNGKYLPCHGIYHKSDVIFLSWHFCEFSYKIISFFFEQLRWYHLSTLNRESLYTDENFNVPPKSWSTFYERLLI